MLTPDDRRYHAEHTWAQPATDGSVRVGVTDKAQDELGEIIYLDLPDAGKAVTQGESMGEIESVKTVSQLISPVSGTVEERNQGAIDEPENVNADPYGDGWLVRVRLTDTAQLESLLSGAEYKALTEPS